MVDDATRSAPASPYGGRFDAAGLSNAAPYLTDPRSLGPAVPFAVYAGL